ncbi:MAG: hypothetical protein KDA89_20765, partial [Planctomycetaceae bacterium]|nr:hypothetical protein [Planctomycetaceae bacterium]
DLWVEDSGPTTVVNDINATAPIQVTIVIDAQPDPPVPVTPDYVIDEGDALLLDASGSTDPDLAYAGSVTEQLFYSWDLNNDGTFDVSGLTAAQTSVTYQTLLNLGLTAPSVNDIVLRVTDTFSGTSVTTSATLTILTVDYGDAPTPYGTLKADTGAAHTIVPGLHLGAAIDNETDGQIPPGTDGADEDGITIDPGLQGHATIATPAWFTANASAPGKLDIWIDFNNNGQFDSSEHLNFGTSYDVVAGDNTFNFTVPAGTVTGVDTWVRARLTSAGGQQPTGRADDGEVEDYQIQIAPLRDAVAVTHVLPMWPQTSDLTPILQWEPVAGSPPGANATYDIELRNSLNQVVGFEQGHVGESIEVRDPLPPGTYTAIITSYNRGGIVGPQSTLQAFEVVAITVTAPTANQNTGFPVISWTDVERTDHYELEIRDALSGALVRQELSLSGTGNSFTVPDELPLGSYQVRVRAIELTTLQTGDWSPYQTFQVLTSPTVTAPVGSTTDTTPTITWSAVPGAASYDVRLHNVTDDIDNVVSVNNVSGTTFTVSQALPMAEYAAEIRGVTTLGVAGNWTSGTTFIVSIPGAVLTPSGRTADATPTFTWQTVPGADNYDLEVIDLGTGDPVIEINGFTNPRYTLPDIDALPLGNYGVRVRANNRPATGVSAQTVSAFSPTVNFTISVPPEVLSPAVGIYDTTPQITWSLPSGAAFSELEVFSVDQNAVVLTRSNITGGSYTLSTAEQLAPGEYRIRVRSSNTDGTAVTDWSTDHVFQIGRAPVLLGPSSGVGTAPFLRTESARPTLTWQQSLAGEKSKIWISDVTNGRVLYIVDGLSTASYTVPANLPIGTYRYWVQAQSGVGERSDWSAAYTFSVVTPPTVAPQPPTFDNTPTIEWSHADAALPEVTWQLWLNRIDRNPAQIVLIKNGLTGTSYEITAADLGGLGLENGLYRVWVRGVVTGSNTAAGTTTTSWSAGQSFYVGGRPTVTPIGTTNDLTPQISWTAVEGAASYRVYIAPTATPGVPVVDVTGVTTSSYQVPNSLAAGSYKVWVQAKSGSGTLSPWSIPVTMSVAVTTTPVVNAVASSSDPTPTFSWSPVTTASRYDIFVALASAPSTALIRDTNVAGTSYTSQTVLAPGSYRVWVRAIDSANVVGPWSDPVAFTILAAAENSDLNAAETAVFASFATIENEFVAADVVPVAELPPAVVTESAGDAQSAPESYSATVPTTVGMASVAPATEDATGQPAEIGEDDVMADWDAAIWEVESAERTETVAAIESQEAPRGWLAGLAMLSPGMLLRRRNRK